ncbi:MAG: T9SS type A sorting domain-containing protein [Bacteroidales bacterium]|nr:T9SS type A sorting domain-containing protein [Bacteroidales bacterium]
MDKNLQRFKSIALMAMALFAFSFGASAQSWYTMGEYIWSPPNPQGTYEELHYQAEDVEIDGLVYHTVYIQGQGELLGAYREEGNQVYCRKWDGTAYDEEEMLYDYDLEEGDYFNDLDDHPMMVESITTITDFNGQPRRMFEFSFMGLEEETEYWIEGVGSSRGFFNRGRYTPTNQGAIFHLLCFHIGDNLIYLNPEYNACDIDEIDENNAETGINVCPNPATGIVRILNPNGSAIDKIEVIDLLGRTVISTPATETIDVSRLPEGQYFVRIQGETTIVRKLSVTK